MSHEHDLAPCLVGRGTLANPRDMLRALETLESLEYRFTAHGVDVDEGKAALVKLMADPESATLVVNGCLFLNVLSFRYLDFEPLPEDRWRFALYGDGSMLELISVPEAEDETAASGRPHLLSEETAPDFESLIALDDEDDEE
ncbi:MAG TPA: hypothetical protein VIL41_04305 [Coriobacteriia bacterium]